MNNLRYRLAFLRTLRHAAFLGRWRLTAALAAVCLAGLPSAVHGRPPAVPANESRIDEIVAMLDEHPSPSMPPRSDRTFWNARASHPQSSNLVARAERIVAASIPDASDELFLMFSRKGSRVEYEKVYWERLGGMRALVFAECIENKGRFTSRLADYLESVAAQRTWVVPAHDPNLGNFNGTEFGICHASAVYCRDVAYALALLGDVLPERTVRAARVALDRRGFSVYLRKAADPKAKGDIFGWFFGRYNWTPVCHGMLVDAALALVEDRVARARFIEGLERGLACYVEEFRPDGYCPEGLHYWNMGFKDYLIGKLRVRQATHGRLDLLSDPINLKTMEYSRAMMMTESGAPRFGDTDGEMASVEVVALASSVWPQYATRRSEAMKAAAPLQTCGLMGAPIPDAPASLALPVRSWFPLRQVLIARPRPGGRLAFAVKGGNNGEFHNHNDLGAYNLCVDGRLAGGDLGYETYTARTFSPRRYESKILSSYAHPVPVVNGRLQVVGAERTAKVVAAEFGDDRDVVSLDLAAAYDDPSLTSLLRTIVYDRAHDAVTVRDRAVFSSPGTLAVPFVWRQGDAVDRLEVSFSSPAGKSSESMETIDDPGRPNVFRRLFAVPEASSTVEVVTHIGVKP